MGLAFTSPRGLQQTKKYFHENRNKKKSCVAIHISKKIDFRPKIEARDKGSFIMIKGSIHPEQITAVNIYAPNNEAPKYLKQINKP